MTMTVEITVADLADMAQPPKSGSDSELKTALRRIVELMLFAKHENVELQAFVTCLYSDANYTNLPNQVWRPIGRVLNTHVANNWRGLTRGRIVTVPVYVDKEKSLARDRRFAFTDAEAKRFKPTLSAQEAEALVKGAVVVNITTEAEKVAEAAKIAAKIAATAEPEK